MPNGNERGSACTRRARKASVLRLFSVPLRGQRMCECFYCKAKLDIKTMTLDRIVPGCMGGKYEVENLRPACFKCNSRLGGALRAQK